MTEKTNQSVANLGYHAHIYYDPARTRAVAERVCAAIEEKFPVEIDGFRQSMDEVAAFRFGSVRGSYAGQKGNDRNVGVIGVAVFAERGATQPWTEREIGRRETADPFPGRFAAPPVAR